MPPGQIQLHRQWLGTVLAQDLEMGPGPGLLHVHCPQVGVLDRAVGEHGAGDPLDHVL